MCSNICVICSSTSVTVPYEPRVIDRADRVAIAETLDFYDPSASRWNWHADCKVRSQPAQRECHV
jgi:hypothetical protein